MKRTTIDMHRWASGLHEKALGQRRGKERELLLQQSMRALPSSAAMWGLQGPPDGRAVGVVSLGKINADDSALESFGNKNPLSRRLHKDSAVAVSLKSPNCSPATEQALSRLGYGAAVIAWAPQTPRHPAQVFAWYREHDEDEFSEEDSEVAVICALHLAASARNVWRRNLVTSRERGATNSRALVTREGHLVAATTEYHDVCRGAKLTRQFPGGAVGYRFDQAMQIDRKKQLAISTESIGSLLLVHLEHLPWLAELSQREAQIALVARRGLSAKEIARQFDLSPTTISNHLARVYRRLAINSRRELAML